MYHFRFLCFFFPPREHVSYLSSANNIDSGSDCTESTDRPWVWAVRIFEWILLKTITIRLDVDNTCQKIETVSYLYSRFNPFPSKPLFFTCLQYKFFENTQEKEEIARDEQFLLLP